LTTETPSNNNNNNNKNNKKPPRWFRLLELGLGVTAIILTIVTLTYPGITTQTIIRIVSAVLLIIGFERIAVGIALPSQNKSTRLANIGLGPLIISLAIVVIVFPLSPSRPPIALGALALLFNGISKIVQGARVKEIPGWSRRILLGVGGLNIFVSVLAIIAPSYGESALARSISITLLITGIQMITSTIGIKKKYSKSQVSTR
jgi:uncharacterized membrane protein HdeD (DUF308 family)